MKRWATFLLVAFIAAVLLALTGCEPSAIRGKQCQLSSSTPTGRHVYCGKACFRPEKMNTYWCANGETVRVVQ